MKKTAHPAIRKAVVTGGLGMIGSALCRQLLDEGIAVTVIDQFMFGRRADALPDHPALMIIKADIRDKKKMDRIFSTVKPQVVFHLAAIAFIPKCMADPAEAIAVHLGGTKNVFEAARNAGVKRLFFSSTADVYSTRNRYLSEASEVDPPPDVYGMTKYMGEHLAESFYHAVEGASVTVGRLFNVYSQYPTNRFLIPAICEQVAENKKTIQLGKLDVRRDYTHAEDVARAIRMLTAKNTGKFLVVNVGSGKAISVRELVTLIGSIVGRPIKIVSRASKRRPIDRDAWQADRRLIKKLVGWEPRVSLEDGLRQILTPDRRGLKRT